jgi:tetratricopeptide (TPR) repeat protein
MKKKTKIIIVIVLVIVAIPCIVMYLRYRSNVALGKELRKEVDAWLASLPKIPESENGAPVINKAVEQFDDFYDVFQDWNPRIDSEAAATTFRNYLAGKKEAFDLLEKGLAYEKWAYTTDYEKGNEATIPCLTWFKNAAKVYSLKGNLARMEGRNSDALNEYLNVLRLATTLSEERHLISQITYFVVCYIGLSRISEFIGSSNLPKELLSRSLNALLELSGKRPLISVGFETEYFVYIMAISDIIKGNKSVYDLIGSKKEKSENPAPSKFIYDYGEDVEVFRRWRKQAKQIDPEKYYKVPEDLFNVEAIFEEVGIRLGKPRAILAQVAVPSLESYKVETENIAMFRGAIVLVAVRLYEAKNGSLPESLDELGELVPKEILTDPFSGKELIYRREGDDFYLYSAGYNGVDDKCKDSKPVYEKDVDLEGVPDIVFHAPPVQQE